MDNEKLEQLLALLEHVQMEKPCESCGGNGYTYEYEDGNYRCSECNGSGFVATNFGRRIVNLIAHNKRPHADLAG